MNSKKILELDQLLYFAQFNSSLFIQILFFIMLCLCSNLTISTCSCSVYWKIKIIIIKDWVRGQDVKIEVDNKLKEL